MSESVFEELKRYVSFGAGDEELLRELHPIAQPSFQRFSEVFYERIIAHTEARKTLQAGETIVGRLKVTLQHWMDELLRGPWDEAYFYKRCKIGRMHVRISLPQHYMFGAMDVVRTQFIGLVEATFPGDAAKRQAMADALGKIFALELAVMMHTYREDTLAHQALHFQERLAAIGTLTAGLSHEIRNPLNAAKLQLEVLERRLKKLDPTLQSPLLAPHALVQDEIRRLDHLLEDFLQFARPRQFVPQAVEVKVLVPKVVDLLGEDANRRGITIERSLETDGSIAGEETRLRQVLMNLMLNALEAAGSGGWVRLSAQETDGDIKLMVDDSGPGIPAEMRERIFEPFFTTKATGSGLGLPIVHAIVTQHHGTISVAEAPGGGARFILALPRA